MVDGGMIVARSVALPMALLACAANPAAAQTTCSAAEQFTLDWNAQTQGAQGSGTASYTASDGGGRTETVTISYNGDTAAFQPISFGGTIGTVTTPYIGVINTGGLAATESTLTLGTIFSAYQSNIDNATNSVGLRLTFSKAVREIRFTMLDVDYTANQFRDWIKITGVSPTAGTITPGISSPYGGRNNTTNPGQTAPSTTVIGPYTASVPNFSGSEVVGNTGNSTNTQDLGNLLVSFAQPVTQIDIRYANGPAAYIAGTPGQQAISIHDLNFCTMPVLTMTKTAAPVATTGDNRFNIPGADVDYTITVTNTGGSPVDINTALLGDALPADVTFFNGDIDTATAGTQNFVFTPGTSGLTLAAANITYLNASNTPITPAAGYDAAVRTVRWQPQGTMAANSSFTIRFRTQIN
jgi:uncharacterized repeat protein (TIGR01451 family)